MIGAVVRWHRRERDFVDPVESEGMIAAIDQPRSSPHRWEALVVLADGSAVALDLTRPDVKVELAGAGGAAMQRWARDVLDLKRELGARDAEIKVRAKDLEIAHARVRELEEQMPGTAANTDLDVRRDDDARTKLAAAEARLAAVEAELTAIKKKARRTMPKGPDEESQAHQVQERLAEKPRRLGRLAEDHRDLEENDK